MTTEAENPDRIYLEQMCTHLGRSDKTIRTWMREAPSQHLLADTKMDQTDDPDEIAKINEFRESILPLDLMPQREEEGRKKMYWTTDQLEGMKAFSERKIDRRGFQHQAATA